MTLGLFRCSFKRALFGLCMTVFPSCLSPFGQVSSASDAGGAGWDRRVVSEFEMSELGGSASLM